MTELNDVLAEKVNRWGREVAMFVTEPPDYLTEILALLRLAEVRGRQVEALCKEVCSFYRDDGRMVFHQREAFAREGTLDAEALASLIR
jgi:hypothetical protein